MEVDDHLRGVSANLAFADSLKSAGGDATSVGWAITATFYASLHAVRAFYLASDQVPIDSHEACRALMRRDRRVDPVRKDYEELKQQSERARYYLDDRFSWSDFEFLRRKAVVVIKACCKLAKLQPPSTAPPTTS